MIKHVVDFIKKVRILVNSNCYEYIERKYDDKDYVQVLLEDFLLTPKAALEHIKTLKPQMWVNDEKPNYTLNSNAYVFKKIVNGVKAYIKLEIVGLEPNEQLLIWSFHEDN